MRLQFCAQGHFTIATDRTGSLVSALGSTRFVDDRLVLAGCFNKFRARFGGVLDGIQSLQGPVTTQPRQVIHQFLFLLRRLAFQFCNPGFVVLGEDSLFRQHLYCTREPPNLRVDANSRQLFIDLCEIVQQSLARLRCG